ncbi:MAG: hypothetical protein AB7D02_02220 [Candidatus Paceibacterota bacterium]
MIFVIERIPIENITLKELLLYQYKYGYECVVDADAQQVIVEDKIEEQED